MSVEGLQNFQWNSARSQAAADSLHTDLENAAKAHPNDPKALKRAAEGFEAIFFGEVIKNMRDTVPKTGFLDGGFAEQVYTSLLDDQLAKGMAKEAGGTLADAMVRQLLQKPGGRPSAAPGTKSAASGTKDSPGGPQSAALPRESAVKNEPVSLPVEGRIGSPFGYRSDPSTGKKEMH